MAVGQVRIIGGLWRGRKLTVPDLPGLRPTPDRVRETLFNWLQAALPGAHCLDLFAGSGALGFEALSRGAGYVAMVDQSVQIVAGLQAQAKTFQAQHLEIYVGHVPQQLRAPKKPFDIVFLDPPFAENLLLLCCEYLEEKHFLADGAYIYMETGGVLNETDLPANWQLLKTKKAGRVHYHLAQRNQPKA
jgi:16S rRNA (guanine966-N2)-methyltransferase